MLPALARLGITLVLLLLTVVAWPAEAFASLSEDAARAIELMKARGATGVERRTVFLEEGHPIEIRRDGATGCRVAVVLASRSTSFFVVPWPPPTDAAPAPSGGPPRRRDALAGLLVVASCTEPLRAAVQLASPRGALEIVTAEMPTEPTDLPSELGREVGPTAPRGDPGPPLLPGSLIERRRRAEERARAEGATNVLPLEMKAGPAGNGELRMRLPSGCHRLDVMAEVDASQSGVVPPVDVDVELRELATNEVLARDRGETPDARVETCVAKVTELALVFRGAPSEARVMVSDAIWPLPKWIPARWGPAAQAALATAVRRRVTAVGARGPLTESLGAQGSTQVAVVVEPERCYVAAVALMKGSSRGMRLSAVASSRPSSEEVSAAGSAASVVFCAEGTDVARITVDMPGASLWWVLAVWRLGGTSAVGAASDASTSSTGASGP
jgi:hypothetical protein